MIRVSWQDAGEENAKPKRGPAAVLQAVLNPASNRKPLLPFRSGYLIYLIVDSSFYTFS